MNLNDESDDENLDSEKDEEEQTNKQGCKLF